MTIVGFKSLRFVIHKKILIIINSLFLGSFQENKSCVLCLWLGSRPHGDWEEMAFAYESHFFYDTARVVIRFPYKLCVISIQHS